MSHVSMPFDPQSVDQLMPLSIWITDAGLIKRLGPTMRKLRPDESLVGQRFMDVFDVRRPRTANNLEGLLATEGARIQLAFRDPPATNLKGQVVRLNGAGGALINLSFGISIVEAVAEYGLTISDFAATDLAVEMLYLVEAKSAVMEELRKLNHRLHGAKLMAEEQAFTDTLTGLKNRRGMELLARRIIEASQPFSVMHVDLDFFKSVNDTHGHAAGDHVLQHVARVLLEETRSEDIVVRFGGDEFVLIFDGLVEEAPLSNIAERIIERLEEPIRFNSKDCKISASIGAAVSPDYAEPDLDKMLNDADMALYQSKRNGRAQMTMARQVSQIHPIPPRAISA